MSGAARDSCNTHRVGTWRLTTDRGTLEASGVVVATGAFDVPIIPRWPGLKYFRGEVRHAAHYRQVAPYAGRSVLVVGAGASGLEIATLFADGGAAHVYLSTKDSRTHRV